MDISIGLPSLSIIFAGQAIPAQAIIPARSAWVCFIHPAVPAMAVEMDSEEVTSQGKNLTRVEELEMEGKLVKRTSLSVFDRSRMET